MKREIRIIITICILIAAQGSFAQVRSFGLGVILGEPTGISAKLWTSSVNAFDVGVGWSLRGERIGKYDIAYNDGNRTHIHVDYLWHSFTAIQSTERFPLYFGVGGRINSGGSYNSSLAVRGVFGIAWLPHTAPIDIFLELVPSRQLTSSTGFGIDAAFGIRYFF